MSSLICAWTHCWANIGDAGNMRRHRAYHDVAVKHHRQITTLPVLLKLILTPDLFWYKAGHPQNYWPVTRHSLPWKSMDQWDFHQSAYYLGSHGHFMGPTRLIKSHIGITLSNIPQSYYLKSQGHFTFLKMSIRSHATVNPYNAVQKSKMLHRTRWRLHDVEHKWEEELTNDTPYLALVGELYGACLYTVVKLN